MNFNDCLAIFCYTSLKIKPLLCSAISQVLKNVIRCYINYIVDAAMILFSSYIALQTYIYSHVSLISRHFSLFSREMRRHATLEKREQPQWVSEAQCTAYFALLSSQHISIHTKKPYPNKYFILVRLYFVEFISRFTIYISRDSLTLHFIEVKDFKELLQSPKFTSLQIKLHTGKKGSPSSHASLYVCVCVCYTHAT